ncbi:MAG TPA: phosphatase PAP2 family protein [Burkholderiaceae bacterium]|nr:phosphatase PAP2 family protein [Burkholderiaceae bacterium]
MRRKGAVLLLVAVALVVVFETLPIDTAVQDLFFDPRSAAFVWQHDVAIEQWLHRRLKSVLFLVPAIAAVSALRFGLLARGSDASAPAAARRAAGLSRRWAFILVAMLAAPLAVSVTKQLSNRPCPWDVAGFGGDLPQRGLFDPAPDGQRALACFPAGHPAGGYALFAFALAGGVPGTRSRWLGARAFVGYALLLGSAMGLVRMAQGAHFLSHLLWSAWLVCAVQIVIARLLLRRKRRIISA